jgi:Phosphopantetheine attachment site
VFIRTTISLFLAGIPLLGARLLARIQESFGVELQLRTLFDHPTVADISAEIDRNLAARTSTQTGPTWEYQTDSDSRVE